MELAAMEEACSAGKKMDVFLDKQGKWRKKIARDGSCLFRAVADHVYHYQARHVEIREQVVKYLREHAEEYKPFVETEMVRWDLYLYDMEDCKTWGSEVEINIIKELYGLKFCIFREIPEPVVDAAYEQPIVENGQQSIRPNHIEVVYAGENHYDLVLSNDYRDLAACMQGILYDLLFTTLNVPKPAGLAKGAGYINAEYNQWQVAHRHTWKKHQTVEAIYPGDGEWYTAKILDVFDGTKYKVDFVGYNDIHTVPFKNVRSGRVVPVSPSGFVCEVCIVVCCAVYLI
jgi:hypothetical protein